MKYQIWGMRIKYRTGKNIDYENQDVISNDNFLLWNGHGEFATIFMLFI